MVKAAEPLTHCVPGGVEICVGPTVVGTDNQRYPCQETAAAELQWDEVRGYLDGLLAEPFATVVTKLEFFPSQVGRG